jgi:hypothetical protein
MLVCQAVTQQWLLYSCFFHGHCLAMGLHAALYIYPQEWEGKVCDGPTSSLYKHGHTPFTRYNLMIIPMLLKMLDESEAQSSKANTPATKLYDQQFF